MVVTYCMGLKARSGSEQPYACRYWVSRLGVVVNSHAGSVIRPATNIPGLKARSGSEQPCRECNQASNKHTGSQG